MTAAACLRPRRIANLMIIGLTCLWLPVLKLPAAGSAALALSIGGCGLAFASRRLLRRRAGLYCARRARPRARGARRRVLRRGGVGEACRPGDLGLAAGRAEFARAFGLAGERWWCAADLPPAGLAAAGAAVAFALAAGRDHSAGPLPAGRGGPPGLAVSCAARPAWPGGSRPARRSAGWPVTCSPSPRPAPPPQASAGLSARGFRPSGNFLRIGYQHLLADA